jgi:hypothetical protein
MNRKPSKKNRTNKKGTPELYIDEQLLKIALPDIQNPTENDLRELAESMTETFLDEAQGEGGLIQTAEVRESVKRRVQYTINQLTKKRNLPKEVALFVEEDYFNLVNFLGGGYPYVIDTGILARTFSRYDQEDNWRSIRAELFGIYVDATETELRKSKVQAQQAEARAKKAEKEKKALQKKTKLFKVSAHLPEQMLKGPQLSLFEEVLEDSIEEATSKTAQLDLSATESLILLSLGKQLHRYSQTENPEAQDYYLGNRQDIPEELRTSEQTTRPVIKEDPRKSLPTPQIMLPTYQIAWEYMGKKPSGADEKQVVSLLYKLAQKFFKITYKRETTGKGRRGEGCKNYRYV